MAVFFLERVYLLAGLGMVLVGQVQSGRLKPGMKLDISGKIMEIKSMEIQHKQISEASEGDKISIHLHKGDYNLLKNFRNRILEFE